MKIKTSGNVVWPSLSLKIILVLVLASGVYFRIYNIDRKIVSSDETFTIMHIFDRNFGDAGHQSVFLTAKEMLQYQSPRADENLLHSIVLLAKRPWTFPPLYVVTARLWFQIWHGWESHPPYYILRCFSILLGIVGIWGMYLFCRELFNSDAAGWIAASLMAVSPMQVLYSLVIRAYSVVITVTLFSSYLFLRAVRINTLFCWASYFIALAIGLYSNVLFGFVAISHFFYLFFIEKDRFARVVRNYLFSAGLAFFVFLPWLLRFIFSPMLTYSHYQVLSGRLRPLPFLTGMAKSLGRIFVDLSDPWSQYANLKFGSLAYPFIILLVIASFYFLIRKAKRDAKIFCLSMLMCTFFSLVGIDIVFGGMRSSRIRYYLPAVTLIQAIVALCLSAAAISKDRYKRLAGKTIFIFLLVGGLASCVMISQSKSWWVFENPELPYVAEEINKKPSPLVVCNHDGFALGLSYILNDGVKMYCSDKADFEKIAGNYNHYSDIFLIKPQEELLRLANENGFETQGILTFHSNLPRIQSIYILKKRTF